MRPDTRSLAFLALAGLASHAAAVVVPFTENFDTDSSAWRANDQVAPLSFVASGGPDGSSYASASFSFASQSTGGLPAFAKGHSGFGSSGGALFGDWIASGVSTFSVAVRQDTGVPLSFFVRFAPSTLPGANAFSFAPVPSGVWTTLTVAINPATPFFYEGTTFDSTFNSIGRVQIGVSVPAALAGNPGSFNFDIDQVSIVPAPGATALGALSGLAALRRRR